MPAHAPRRILFVDHVSRILGGAEINLVELAAESAARAQWDLHAACDPEGRLHASLQSLGIPSHPYAFDPTLGTLRIVGRGFPLAGALRSLKAIRRARQDLLRIVTQLRPSVVVSCTNKDHFAAWPACKEAGIPSVWWVNDILSPDFFPWTARRAFRSQATRGASQIVVVSDFARNALIREGLSPERITTIHNGIPLERYQPQPRRTIRNMLAITDAEPLVGIVGRFTPWKGQDLFLRVAQAWCQTSNTGHFVLIGHAFNEDQPYEAALREFIRSQNLRERVHFIPFQRDIASCLSDLDVLVHASLKPEPFGRVVIEAMAVGIPVIAARGGGVPEIVTHSENGLLATPGVAEEYIHHLHVLLNDSDLRARIRDQGQATVAARFSLSRVQTAFESLFAAVSKDPCDSS